MATSGKSTKVTGHSKSLEQLATSLWDFLLACEPHIREAETMDEVQDMILRLEERDDSFHKYDLVRYIRHGLQDSIGAFIEERIDQRWHASSGLQRRDVTIDSVVDEIVNEVVRSNQFVGMQKLFRHEISSAVDRLSADFDELFIHRHEEKDRRSGQHRSHQRHNSKRFSHDSLETHKGSLVYSEAEEFSVTGSGSLTQSGVGFLFLTPDRLSHLAENLREGNAYELRHETMTQLSQLPPGDLLGHESWPQLKPVLEAVLHGGIRTEESYYAEAAELSERAVKLYAKMLQLLNTNCKEVFLSFSKHLKSLFSSSSSMIVIPTLEEGLDMQKTNNHHLMQRFSVICSFVCEIPSFWTRYATKFADDVIAAFLDLLAVEANRDDGSTLKRITPLHFMALVDPKAVWFVRWTHGHYSRTRLLKLLGEPPFKQIVTEYALAILDYGRHLRAVREELGSNATNHPIFDAEDEPRYYSREDLEFLYFVHCFYVITRILNFVDGRRFFPIDVNGVSLTPGGVVVAILKLLNPTICHHGPASISFRNDFYHPPSDSRATEPASVPLQRLSTTTFCPRIMAADAIHALCVRCDEVFILTVCQDKVISLLLAPLKSLLDETATGKKVSASLGTDENTLLFVADILAQMASSGAGFVRILYGSPEDRFPVAVSQSESLSPAHVIASFTKRALKEGVNFQGINQLVTAAFLYVCRQIYKTCEGLLLLRSFQLHSLVATAWRHASRQVAEASTPTPEDRNRTSSTISAASDVSVWERNLMDNLLNFSATPKGVFLLQLTGAMSDCVMYMYSRYDRKQQVSRFEKFGYGTMVSQLATTAAGINALMSTDFVKSLVMQIWECLECDLDDDASASRGPPQAYPLTSIDESLVKPFRVLVNVTSSFPALYELLHDCQLPVGKTYGFREAPTTFLDLIDRLVLVDTPNKIHSLFNYEQSHVFGLKLLSALISSLDCLLLMQTRFHFQEALLTAQRENVSEEGAEDGIIIDMLSIERNYILVRSYVVGGPNERLLPPRDIQTQSDSASYTETTAGASLSRSFPFPLFITFPAPRDYTAPHLRGATTSSSSALPPQDDILRHLEDFRVTMIGGGNHGIYEDFSQAFKTILSTKGHELVKSNVIFEFLELAVTYKAKQKSFAIFPLPETVVNAKTPPKNKDLPSLSAIQLAGIRMAVRYGTTLKIFPVGSDSSANQGMGVVESAHATLLQQCKWLLRHHRQELRSNSTDKSLDGDAYPGHDWLASTIFLLTNGHVDRAWKFLLSLAPLIEGAYLWLPYLSHGPAFPLGVDASPVSFNQESGLHPIFFNTCHLVEMIVHIEMPLVANAVKMSGCTLASTAYRWLSQVFWNFLNWEDVCHYLALSLVLGVDYQVYVCVAIIRHLEQKILIHFQDQDLVVFLCEESLHGFCLVDILPYLFELEKRYRNSVLAFLSNFND